MPMGLGLRSGATALHLGCVSAPEEDVDNPKHWRSPSAYSGCLQRYPRCRKAHGLTRPIINSELGELSEVLQWTSPDLSFSHLPLSTQTNFLSEVADVCIYLLHLCRITDCDISTDLLTCSQFSF